MADAYPILNIAYLNADAEYTALRQRWIELNAEIRLMADSDSAKYPIIALMIETLVDEQLVIGRKLRDLRS